MKTTQEMLQDVIELKKSNKDMIIFEVDDLMQIVVEIYSLEDCDTLKIAIELRYIETKEVLQSISCDYDDDMVLEVCLKHIRDCTFMY